MKAEIIDELFTQHNLKADQLAAVRVINEKARELAVAINLYVPQGPSQTASVRKLKDATMTAALGIAMDGKF